MKGLGNAIKYIVDNVDLLEYLTSHEGLEFKKYGHNMRTLCPFHEDADPSFSVTIGKNAWYCFGCKTGGSVITFHEMKYKQNRARAVAEILTNIDRDINEFVDDPTGGGNDIMTAAHEYFKGIANTLKHQLYKEFFTKKGFDITFIQYEGIGYSVSSEKLVAHLVNKGFIDDEIWRYGLAGEQYTNAIIYPVYSQYGTISYFMCRCFGDTKYVTGDDTIPSYIENLMIGIHELSALNGDYCILVEGINDYLALKAMGMTNVLCMGGVKLNEDMIKTLVGYDMKNIYVWVDGDSAGWNFLNMLAKNYAELFSKYRLAGYACFVNNSDPDEAVLKDGVVPIQVLDKAKLIPIHYLSNRYSDFKLPSKAHIHNAVQHAVDLVKDYDGVTAFHVFDFITEHTGYDIECIQDAYYRVTDKESSSYEYERNLLASIIADKDLIYKHNILPDWFAYKSNRYIFEAILELDQPTKLLLKNRVPEWVGEYVDSLPDAVGVIATDHIHTVKELFNRKSVRAVAKKVLHENMNYEDSLNYMNESTLKLSAGLDTDSVDIGAAMSQTIDTMVGGVDHGYMLSGHWNMTNRILMGIRPKRLILLSGNTGHGKTNLALNWVHDLSILQEYKGLIFSGEMDVEEISARLISIGTGIPNTSLVTNNVDDTDVDKVFQFIKSINKDNLFINEAMDFWQIINTIKYMVYKHGIQYVVIDYIQLIEPSGRLVNMSRPSQLKEMTRVIKNTCKTFNIPAIVVSQLADAGLDDATPQARRQSESKLMQADADVTIAMRMKSQKEIDLDPVGNVIMHIDKLRYNKGKRLIPVDFFDTSLLMKEVLMA